MTLCPRSSIPIGQKFWSSRYFSTFHIYTSGLSSGEYAGILPVINLSWFVSKFCFTNLLMRIVLLFQNVWRNQCISEGSSSGKPIISSQSMHPSFVIKYKFPLGVSADVVKIRSMFSFLWPCLLHFLTALHSWFVDMATFFIFFLIISKPCFHFHPWISALSLDPCLIMQVTIVTILKHNMAILQVLITPKSGGNSNQVKEWV